jgi:hypothetical protein
MTPPGAQKALRKADSLLAEAHSLVLDLCLAREEGG